MAETKNPDNIRIYGDDESAVWIAPKGTVLPATLEDPPAPFKALGWLSEAGAPFSVSVDVEKFKGWQGGAIVRTKVTSTEKSIKVECLEENPLVTELYYDHKPATVTGSGLTKMARIDLPKGIGTVERAAVVRYQDGGVTKYLVCENVQVGDREELPHTSGDITAYGMTLEIVGDAYILTNAPAYIEGE